MTTLYMAMFSPQQVIPYLIVFTSGNLTMIVYLLHVYPFKSMNQTRLTVLNEWSVLVVTYLVLVLLTINEERDSVYIGSMICWALYISIGVNAAIVLWQLIMEAKRRIKRCCQRMRHKKMTQKLAKA